MAIDLDKITFEVEEEIEKEPICVGEEAEKLKEYIKQYVMQSIKATDEVMRRLGIKFDMDRDPLYVLYKVFSERSKDLKTCIDVLGLFVNLYTTMLASHAIDAIVSSDMDRICKEETLILMQTIFAVNPATFYVIKDYVADILVRLVLGIVPRTEKRGE